MAIPTIQPTQIRTGPGLIRWAALGATIPTITPTASKYTAVTWDTAWKEAGATEEGLTYNESTDTEAITVAESVYPVKVVTTGKTGTVAFSMAHISDVNWKLAANGGNITVSGTAGTKQSEYMPPLVGQEVRVMLAFQSAEDDEIIIWPQVFNTGSLEVARSTFESKALLPVEFSVELPDPAVMTRPYKRWTTGALSQAT